LQRFGGVAIWNKVILMSNMRKKEQKQNPKKTIKCVCCKVRGMLVGLVPLKIWI